jgi:hypothetical protein
MAHVCKTPRVLRAFSLQYILQLLFVLQQWTHVGALPRSKSSFAQPLSPSQVSRKLLAQPSYGINPYSPPRAHTRTRTTHALYTHIHGLKGGKNTRPHTRTRTHTHIRTHLKRLMSVINQGSYILFTIGYGFYKSGNIHMQST